ncbi:MAG TPA: hypothetical protein VFS40_01090 [Gemmatimonadales bacterium]|nr:hypothetical protein [Gemmatimonadales bacterium]
MRNLVRTSFVLLLLSIAASPAVAQRPWAAGLAAGWSSARGYDARWDDDGIVSVRGALWRRIGSRLDLGAEGGWHRFGQETFVFECRGPQDGCVEPQTITTEQSSTAWDASLALRWRISDAGVVRPRATFGLGVIERRDVDEATRRRPDGTMIGGPDRFPSSTSLLPLAALGLGVELGPPGGRVAFTLGTRLNLTYDAYDGTPSVPRLVSLLAGVALR